MEWSPMAIPQKRDCPQNDALSGSRFTSYYREALMKLHIEGVDKGVILYRQLCYHSLIFSQVLFCEALMLNTMS